eukprot:220663-Hanusia_phi.AAC.1
MKDCRRFTTGAMLKTLLAAFSGCLNIYIWYSTMFLPCSFTMFFIYPFGVVSFSRAHEIGVENVEHFHTSKFLKGDRNRETRVRSVTTDSVSLCIHIERDIKIPIDMTVENDATCTGTSQTEWVSNDFLNRRVLAVDPGRVTPYCGVGISSQGKTIVHKFSR